MFFLLQIFYANHYQSIPIEFSFLSLKIVFFLTFRLAALSEGKRFSLSEYLHKMTNSTQCEMFKCEATEILTACRYSFFFFSSLQDPSLLTWLRC